MPEARLISIGITLLIIIFGIVMCFMEGNWLAPGPFFALVWTAYLMFPLGLTDYNIQPAGVLWILFAVLVVNLGSQMGSGNRFIKGQLTRTPQELEAEIPRPPMSFPGLTKLTLICTLLGFGAVVVLVLDSGVGLSSFFSLSSLGEMGREYSMLRYSDTSYREPEVAIFFTTFIFGGAFLGGTLFATGAGKLQRGVALLPFGVALLHASVLTTRASILFSGIIWVSAYLAAEVCTTQGRVALFTGWRVFFLVTGGLAVFITYIVLQMIRWGMDLNMISLEDVRQTIPEFVSAFFGSPATFTQWFAAHWQDATTTTYGAFTFPYINKLFGEFGKLRFEATQIGVDPLTQSTTTVFTMFRDLIEDYTIFGTVPLLLLLGLLAGWAYRRILQGKARYLPVLAACYCIFIGSLTGFMFAYTTILAAWILYEGCILLTLKNDG